MLCVVVAFNHADFNTFFVFLLNPGVVPPFLPTILPLPHYALQEETIEQIIALGQLEEMIQQGKDELTLIDKYYESKIWEEIERMNEGRTDLELDDWLDPINPVESGEDKAEATSAK